MLIIRFECAHFCNTVLENTESDKINKSEPPFHQIKKTSKSSRNEISKQGFQNILCLHLLLPCPFQFIPIQILHVSRIRITLFIKSRIWRPLILFQNNVRQSTAIQYVSQFIIGLTEIFLPLNTNPHSTCQAQRTSIRLVFKSLRHTDRPLGLFFP